MENESTHEEENLCPMFDTRNLITEMINDYWTYEDIAEVRYNKLVFSQLVAMICERTVVRTARIASWIIGVKLESQYMSEVQRDILRDEVETEVLKAIGFSRSQST